MTYEEIFKQFRQISGEHAGQRMSDQELDGMIALVSQLPCTGEGPSRPVLSRKPVAVDVRYVDSGKKLPHGLGLGCMHCTWLETFKWIKSLRDGTAKEFCDCGKDTCITCTMLKGLRQG